MGVPRPRPWVWVLCLVLVFAALGYLSEGTHNDDDIARYLNVRAAFEDGDQFLSPWNRPAFVLLYALPVHLGYGAVELLTALIAALTGYLAYRTARVMGEDNALLALFFTAVQPFFLMLSYSALTEPLAAFLLAGSLYLLYRGRLLCSALVAAAVPLARLELVLLLVPWAIRYAVPGHGLPESSRGRRWAAVALLPLGLLAWNAAGAAVHGDPLYLLHAVVEGEDRLYDAVGIGHYLKGYIFIVGPVVFAFSILGFVEAVRTRGLLLVGGSVLIMLVALTWLSSASSVGQAAGFLRHVVAVSPLIGLLAVRGFNVWYRPRPSLSVILLLLLGALVCWRVLSVELVRGMYQGTHPEYTKLGILVVLGLLPVLARLAPRSFRSARARPVLLVLPVLLAAGYALRAAGIQHLSPEQAMMKEVAAWYREAGLSDRVTLCNHPWFYFFTSGRPVRPHTIVTHANMAQAPPGAIVIWEGHYAHRLAGDVGLEEMEGQRDYRIVDRFVGSEGRTFTVVFEKTAGTADDGVLTADAYDHPGLGVHWDLRGTGEWQFKPQHDKLQLLRGRHPQGALLLLQLERAFRFSDWARYPEIVEHRLQSTRGMTLDRKESRGEWVWLWGKGANTVPVLAVRLFPERWAALTVGCVFPRGKESWMADELAALLEGLTLDAPPIAGHLR